RTRQITEHKMATYQCDGWKNVVKTSVITSMMTVDSLPYLLCTHDMTGKSKTGDKLFNLVKDNIVYMESTYGVNMIMITTDDGPDGKKMRHLHAATYPHIAMFVCWAHQSGLLTGNYLAIKSPFMTSAARAIEVIKWFNNHQRALDLLHSQQLCTTGHILALILPVVMRWTGYYCALKQLHSQSSSIMGCVAANKQQLLVAAGAMSDLKAKALEVIMICCDEQFWNDLAKIVSHLKLLAILANILQDPACCLDHVLLTLMRNFCFFETLHSTNDTFIQKMMHVSLEHQWAKADQELFILAVFFNPYIWACCFNPEKITQFDLFHMVHRVYQWLFHQSIHSDFNFTAAFEDYYSDLGQFSSDSMYLSGFEAEYHAGGHEIDFTGIWKKLCGANTVQTGRSGFVKLAIWILTMVPNSAGTECVFSTFGLTHTKTCNQINPQKVHNATLVRMNRRHTHIDAGLIPQCKKRK
ncbi:ribonuclease H-like domain-containing protein, partial [Cyathus striatus]